MMIFEEAGTFWTPRLTQFDPIITTSVADPADLLTPSSSSETF